MGGGERKESRKKLRGGICSLSVLNFKFKILTLRGGGKGVEITNMEKRGNGYKFCYKYKLRNLRKSV